MAFSFFSATVLSFCHIIIVFHLLPVFQHWMASERVSR